MKGRDNVEGGEGEWGKMVKKGRRKEQFVIFAAPGMWKTAKHGPGKTPWEGPGPGSAETVDRAWCAHCAGQKNLM